MFSQHPLQKWQCGNFADSEYYLFDVSAELEKDAHADFLCLHCYPNAVGDNTWAYLSKILSSLFALSLHSNLPYVRFPPLPDLPGIGASGRLNMQTKNKNTAFHMRNMQALKCMIQKTSKFLHSIAL